MKLIQWELISLARDSITLQMVWTIHHGEKKRIVGGVCVLCVCVCVCERVCMFWEVGEVEYSRTSIKNTLEQRVTSTHLDGTIQFFNCGTQLLLFRCHI